MDEKIDLSPTLNSKSDQISADDLIAGSKIIKVTNVKIKVGDQQPMIVEYEGMNGKTFKPCLTMRKMLIKAWTDNGFNWIGKSIKLYRDSSVVFAAVKVGGVRVSHLSHIDKPIKEMLQVSRGKRVEFVIDPLPFYPDADFVEKHVTWIEAIKTGKITLGDLIEKVSEKGILTYEQIEILKGEVSNEI